MIMLFINMFIFIFLTAINDSNNDLAYQRKLVNQRLGLDVAEAIGLDTQNIFSNEDLISENSVSTPKVYILLFNNLCVRY